MLFSFSLPYTYYITGFQPMGEAVVLKRAERV